jgi:hypothetical protein
MYTKSHIKHKELATVHLWRARMHRELLSKSSVSKKPPTQGDSQSDLHFLAMMGDQFHEHNSSPEKKVDAFDLIYSQLPVAMNDAQRAQFAQMLIEEQQHPDQYVFYHATKSSVGFIYDVITEFRKQLELRYDDVYYLRAFDDVFTYENVHNLVTISSHDHNEIFRDVGLAVNPFLFGSDGEKCESSYFYYLTDFSQIYPEQKTIFDYFAKRLKLGDVDFSILEAIFKERIENSGGVLYQIFIDKSVVDQVAAPATLNGRINPLKTNEGELKEFSAVFNKLRQDPKTHAKYIKTLQARLYLKPEIFHDTSKVQIKTYRAYPLADDEAYKKELRETIMGCLNPSLPNYQTFSPTAFVNGAPALHKLMGMIYQGHNLVIPETADITIKIPQLIANGNIAALIDLMANTEVLDLTTICDLGKANSCILLHLFQGDLAVQVYNALQIYKEKPHIPKILAQLQEEVWYQYVRTGDFPKVDELFSAVLHKDAQYLNANQLFIMELFPYNFLDKGLTLAAEHKQDAIFKFLFEKCQEFHYKPSVREPALSLAIQFGYLEKTPKKETEKKIEQVSETDQLDLALESAALNNQVDAFGELLIKCRQLDYKFKEYRLKDIALKHKYYRILEKILDNLPKVELTASYFFNILQHRVIYDDPNTLEVILEKMRIIPEEDLFNRVFKSVVLFNMVEKGCEKLLEKIFNEHNYLCHRLGEIRYENKSLLIVAIENHLSHIVNLLLAYSDDKNKFVCDSSSYRNALLLATRQNDLPIVKMLLEHINVFDERDQYGKTALVVAAELGYKEIVAAFLECDKISKNPAYLSSKTIDGHDAASLAAKRGHSEVVNMLLNPQPTSKYILHLS